MVGSGLAATPLAGAAVPAAGFSAAAIGAPRPGSICLVTDGGFSGPGKFAAVVAPNFSGAGAFAPTAAGGLSGTAEVAAVVAGSFAGTGKTAGAVARGLARPDVDSRWVALSTLFKATLWAAPFDAPSGVTLSVAESCSAPLLFSSS
jgi:hypothetical protein